MNNNSIVFFTGDSFQSKALANELKKKFDLRAIIIQEKKVSGKQKLIIRILQKIIGVTLLELILIYRKPKKERLTLLTERRLKRQSQVSLTNRLNNFNTYVWPDVPILKTTDINSVQVEKFLRPLHPTLGVVWGTGILKKNIIDIPHLGIINAHTSVLPNYRGSFAEFWQCLNDDYDYAGVTYHFVNEKVDEGDIIHVEKYKGVKPVDPYTLREENTISIVENFPKVIQSLFDGTYIRIKQSDENARTYLYKHITLDTKYNLFRKIDLL